MSQIIKPKDMVKRVMRSFRLKEDLDRKIKSICSETGESQTHVVESLLEFAIKAYEKENLNSNKN